jgi:predicted acyltransferase
MDLAYRYFPVAGFDHPWVNFENLGAWVNNHIEGVTKASTWASINAFTTTAHTIWGVLCGRLLMSKISDTGKMKKLFIAGMICLLSGYALDLLDVTPIIKKIATSSFVLVSGGYAILALLFCYYLIDVRKKMQRSSQFFIVMGANSLFIYLFFSAGGVELLNRIIHPFIVLLFKWSGSISTDILTSISIWAVMWYLCYWLYRNKIFFKV